MRTKCELHFKRVRGAWEHMSFDSIKAEFKGLPFPPPKHTYTHTRTNTPTHGGSGKFPPPPPPTPNAHNSVFSTSRVCSIIKAHMEKQISFAFRVQSPRFSQSLLFPEDKNKEILIFMSSRAPGSKWSLGNSNLHLAEAIQKCSIFKTKTVS